MKYKVGDKIWFAEEKRPYKIQACDERFLVCTKPFNPRHTVQYTLVDLNEEIRGADNYWKWGGYFEYETSDGCERALRALNGDLPDEDKPFGISRRNVVELNIVRHESTKDSKTAKTLL